MTVTVKAVELSVNGKMYRAGDTVGIDDITARQLASLGAVELPAEKRQPQRPEPRNQE